MGLVRSVVGFMMGVGGAFRFREQQTHLDMPLSCTFCLGRAGLRPRARGLGSSVEGVTIWAVKGVLGLSDRNPT